MAFIPPSSNQGSLLELVARGQKDTFFTGDDPLNKWPFDNSYEPCSPFLSERRTIVPLNDPRFGGSFEIELDKYGDILTECALLIELPSWLPPLPVEPSGAPVNPAIANGLYVIQDREENTYGYTNYIGYLMFESIQFYQDQVLLQEWSGEGLLSTQVTEGSWNSSFLDQTVAGMTNVSSLGGNTSWIIAQRATPGRLRLRIPLPGLQTRGDGGFPFCCLPSQSYRLRIRLRKLEDLVECSNRSIVKPAPWNVPQFTYRYRISTPFEQPTYSFAPLSFTQIPNPTILLETSQVYIPPNVARSLQEKVVTIPYRKVFENAFTIGELDYSPLDIPGAVATITRRLDARHISERVVFIFRTADSIDRNQLYDFRNPLGGDAGDFYTQLKLVIAGRDREEYAPATVWRDYSALAKDERDNGLNIGSIRWNTGENYDRTPPYTRQAEGGVNFSMADKPTIYIQLINVPVNKCLGARSAEMRVFIESWCMYEIKEGRGRQLFAS